MTIIDIHTNLGTFPDSGNTRSKEVHASPDVLAAFLKANNISRHVCLYPRDGYDLLEELDRKAPDVTHYGLQVIPGTKNSPTYLRDVGLDVLDKSKPLCYGIKLASHRGWWVRKIDSVEGNESGLNYGAYSRQINRLLKRLPENAIVAFHLQGDPINNSGSIPMMVGKFAQQFPHLKFIMNHAGDYGPESQGGKNTKLIYVKDDGSYMLFPAFRHAHSRATIKACIEYAHALHNIWIDSSCFMCHKAELLKETEKWCVGSDFPFMNKPDLFLSEERKFLKIVGPDAITRAYTNTLHWLETDWQQLYSDHVDKLKLDDNIEEAIALVRSNLQKKRTTIALP